MKNGKNKSIKATIQPQYIRANATQKIYELYPANKLKGIAIVALIEHNKPYGPPIFVEENKLKNFTWITPEEVLNCDLVNS
jgi:hypothetical protein